MKAFKGFTIGVIAGSLMWTGIGFGVMAVHTAFPGMVASVMLALL